MFEYLKSFQTLRNTTLSSLRKPWCSQTLSFIRCGSGPPEIPLAMHPGLSRTSTRTLILMGLWLGRSVSSLKILESLGKFIPERDNLQHSSFQLKKKKNWTESKCLGKTMKGTHQLGMITVHESCRSKESKKLPPSGICSQTLEATPESQGHSCCCRHISFPYQMGNSVTSNTPSL